ncbi:MAG: hypothetical protein U0746_06430 [Gemmataceae bacterium]
MARFRIAVILFAVCPLGLDAADAPRKEPIYAGKPMYCRLAFGRDQAIVWLALDGDKLYADQNANGDLTDDGAPAVAVVDGSGDTAWRTFRLTDLRVAGRTHRALTLTVMALRAAGSDLASVKDLLAKQPDARSYRLTLDVEMPGRTGSGLGGRVVTTAGIADYWGVLQFAAKPADSPLVHFDGPLTLAPEERPSFAARREADLRLVVGTRGKGAGTFAAMVIDDLIPADAFPVAEVTYPPRTPGDPPVRRRYELKQRC